MFLILIQIQFFNSSCRSRTRTAATVQVCRIQDLSILFVGLLDSLRDSTSNLSGFDSKEGAEKASAGALTVPAEALQAVSQQLTVSVHPPRFVHHFVQLLVFILPCKTNARCVCAFDERQGKRELSSGKDAGLVQPCWWRR